MIGTDSYFYRYGKGTKKYALSFPVPIFSGTERQNCASFKRKSVPDMGQNGYGTEEIFKKIFFWGGILCPYEKKNFSSFLVPVPCTKFVYEIVCN